MYPGAVLHARNGQQTLKVMQDVAQLGKYDILQLLDMVLSLMDRISGITAALAGSSDASTATEASINARQSNDRIGAEMAVSDEAWCEVGNKTYNLIQQYQSDEVSAKLSGGRSVEFAPEQLVDMMITPRSASSERVLKDLERQDMQALWEISKETMTDPASQMPSMDLVGNLKRLVESFGGDPRTVRPPATPQLPAVPELAPDMLDEAGVPVDPVTMQPLAQPEQGAPANAA